jgi:hypothetical protein
VQAHAVEFSPLAVERKAKRAFVSQEVGKKGRADLSNHGANRAMWCQRSVSGGYSYRPEDGVLPVSMRSPAAGVTDGPAAEALLRRSEVLCRSSPPST